MLTIAENTWEIRETKNRGRGVFAKLAIAKGTTIGEYVGKICKLQDLDFESERKNMYAMYLTDETYLYPHDIKAAGVHLLNHSCDPNCTISHKNSQILIVCIRPIQPNEEITIDYRLPPAENCNPCTHQCFCESANCRGTMHLSEEEYQTSIC